MRWYSAAGDVCGGRNHTSVRKAEPCTEPEPGDTGGGEDGGRWVERHGSSREERESTGALVLRRRRREERGVRATADPPRGRGTNPAENTGQLEIRARTQVILNRWQCLWAMNLRYWGGPNRWGPKAGVGDPGRGGAGEMGVGRPGDVFGKDESALPRWNQQEPTQLTWTHPFGAGKASRCAASLLLGIAHRGSNRRQRRTQTGEPYMQ